MEGVLIILLCIAKFIHNGEPGRNILSRFGQINRAPDTFIRTENGNKRKKLDDNSNVQQRIEQNHAPVNANYNPRGNDSNNQSNRKPIGG